MNARKEKPAPELVVVDAPVNSQVQLLRSRVEAELKKPAVVLVTSAHSGDGKSLTASSLATCFAKSGHHAALVNGTRAPGDDGETLSFEHHSQGHAVLLDLPAESDSAVSREGLAAFVDSLRSEYDYTIVDAGPYLKSNSAIALTQLVDGILLTVRVGRASSDEDEMMVRMVEHFRGNVIGVVATDADAIDEFAKKRPRNATVSPARSRKPERKAAQALVSSVMCAAMFLMLDASSQAGQTAQRSALDRLPAQVISLVDRVTHAVSAPLALADDSKTSGPFALSGD